MQRCGVLAGWRAFQCVFLILIALCFFFALPRVAQADCAVEFGSPSTSSVTFTLPAQISVPSNTPVGTIIATSAPVTPSPTVFLDCPDFTTDGLTNNISPQASSCNDEGTPTIYPTNISGLGYILVHNTGAPWYIPEYPCDTGLSYSSWQMSDNSQIELITTGPITNGSQLQAGQVARWQVSGGVTPETFTLGNPVRIVVPCVVSTRSIAVNLPSISSSALSAVGATAGTTGFTISLNCAAGATLGIDFTSNGKASDITGVLLPTSGTAAGVGVQMLDSNSNPIVFGAKSTSSTMQGQESLQYYVRYYRTSTVTPGSLKASATFTLSYQ